MNAEFNPYREWLSIPLSELPANFYRLLGLSLFESDVNVIEKAADRQMTFVRTFQTGQYSRQSQQILNELAKARIILLNKEKKAQYDAKLKAMQNAGSTVEIDVDSLLDSDDIKLVPQLSKPSQTPQPWSNPTVASSSNTPEPSPSENNTPPPIPNSQNNSEKYCIAILSALVVVQLIIFGIVQLEYFLKPSSTEIAQNQTHQKDDGEESAEAKVRRLAEHYYNQSVELQDIEDYDEAMCKATVAVDLQPNDELYKAQLQTLARLIKSLEKTKKTLIAEADTNNSEQEKPVSVADNTGCSADSGHFDGHKRAGDREVFRVNGVEFAFHWCPAGTFTMGSPESEEGHGDKEIQHQVTLTKGFWIMETEVTVGMFKAFVNDTGYKSKGNTPYGRIGNESELNPNLSWLDPGFKQDDNHPVSCVSWDDATEFCKWLSRKTEQNITLPTEAQWEYACRAGSTTAYFWGNVLNGDKADCNGNFPYGTKTKGKYIGKTMPVGSYLPNAWGLYDMHGNVYEWCQDWDGDYSNESVTDPIGPLSGSNRISRGGGWDNMAQRCRSASRYGVSPERRGDLLGFRCVKNH